MKKILHSFLFFAFAGIAQTGNAQTDLALNQNPLFEVSRSKYMAMADSLNKWHSTTIQNTYKAIDFLEDKKIARAEKQAFRRELKLERAKRGYYNNYYRNYTPSRYYNNRIYDYYPNYRYNGYRPYYSPFGSHSYLMNTVPLALTLGFLCR